MGGQGSGRLTRHGQSYNKIYRVWQCMRSRCDRTTDKSYERYGGRGIIVCAEWSSFDNFFKWATTNGYEDGLTIDRKDPDGNYCPGNCRFLTRAENSRLAM